MFRTPIIGNRSPTFWLYFRLIDVCCSIPTRVILTHETIVERVICGYFRTSIVVDGHRVIGNLVVIFALFGLCIVIVVVDTITVLE
jgi:hypothetical protein